MPKEGSNAWYRAYADRFYLNKANKDLYLYRSSSTKLGLSSGLVVPALETLDGVDLSVHAADLDAHQGDEMLILRTGDYYIFPPYYPSGTYTPGANTLGAFPIRVPRDMTFDRIAIEVTVAVAGKNAVLGFYNDGTNSYPGALLVDAGTVSVADIAIVAATISRQLLKDRDYWLAISSQDAPTIRGLAIIGAKLGLRSTNLGAIETQWRVNFTYTGTLPDPFPASAIKRADCPSIPLRLLTLD